jgi:CheY-like chemotaxis protein
MRFEVADTGIGIAESARKNLFESFVQVDGTTTRKHEGTGLGLAISQQLVQIMGGEIGFDSAIGSGSTFWFEIPLETAASTAIDWNALKGLRILIADDHSGSSGALMDVVRSWGMAAEKVASGEAALKAMERGFERHERFDLALVDLRSPQMDALEFVRAVRGSLHLHSTKFLLHVPAGWKGVRIPLTHTGIARLMKPAPREQMFVAIARLCRRNIMGNSTSQEEVSIQTIASAGSLPARGLSVLVAEDNRVNQRVITGLLQRLGHRCEVVSDGKAAIEAASTRRYDVVLMDCQMPSVDGFEATAAIRKLAHPVGSVPIIAVTANAMIGDRERCLAAGMDGYIAKPIHLDQLVHALGNIECHRAIAV